MEHRAGFVVASEDDAVALLEAYVLGERHLDRLRKGYEQSGLDPRSVPHGALAALAKHQERRYQALEAWWARERTASGRSRPAHAGHSAAFPRALGWLWQWLAPRAACPE